MQHHTHTHTHTHTQYGAASPPLGSDTEPDTTESIVPLAARRAQRLVQHSPEDVVDRRRNFQCCVTKNVLA